jgi:tetratricopeptide (TPR) repeat protein
MTLCSILTFLRTRSVHAATAALAAAVCCFSLISAALADDLQLALDSTGRASVAAVSRFQEKNPASQDRIEQLINDLGNPRYAARRMAAIELRQIGAEAFDRLHAATEHSDPEIAAAAHYLLRQISVRWVQADDASPVRALLRDFAKQSDSERLQRIIDLAALPERAGVAGLCRIARFDRSPLISRMAALSIIRPTDSTKTTAPIDPAVVEQELGASTRVASTWLRQYLAQLRDPAAAAAAWQPLIDEEAKRLESAVGETSPGIVVRLMWNLADVHRQLGDTQATIAVVNRMFELDQQGLELTAIGVLSWLTEHKSWPVLDAFLEKHQARIEQSKRPLYYAAMARAQQGKKELAEELALKASQLEPQIDRDCFYTAKDLEEHSQYDWAVREYRRAINENSDDPLETIISRIALANLMHDYEHHAEAADALEPLFKALNGEGPIAKQYLEIQQALARRKSGLPEINTLKARLFYYRGCQYRDEKDWQRARECFVTAITADPSDADILIAMYRLPDADDAWRQSTRERINTLAEKIQQDIDDKPGDPSPYNQWAWLVANTEGDLQKAIRYSHRSLELNDNGDSGAASYLDTLGRCYYAAGDVKNAVKYQRQAVEKVNYMQVMQRQLALFEKKLAEQIPNQQN